MKVSEICSLIEGVVVIGESRLDDEVEYAFASDLMSDVLTVKIQNFILLTGLCNIQSVRTAEMSDVPYMIVCRNKQVTPDMLEIAEESNIVIICTQYSLFRCAGLLYSNGLKPVY
ncbi:DRTGG Domain Protein [Bacteroidales bacterium CF]|jgi:predicted transcriptional regulator|nr:DRTGG Domain Protein [Bacteroidales bacterium CF]